MKKYFVEVNEYATIWRNAVGAVHREGGPAVEWNNGTNDWRKNGSLHREDGPAREYHDGRKAWFIEGIGYTEEEFNAKINPVKELTVSEIEKLLGHSVKIVK